MSHARTRIPDSIGVKTDKPGTTQPDQPYGKPKAEETPPPPPEPTVPVNGDPEQG